MSNPFNLQVLIVSHDNEVFLNYFNRYILEGRELDFYVKKIQRKKGKGGAGATA